LPDSLADRFRRQRRRGAPCLDYGADGLASCAPSLKIIAHGGEIEICEFLCCADSLPKQPFFNGGLFLRFGLGGGVLILKRF
jgi:hypothetical protein